MIKITLPGMTEFPDLNGLFLSFYRDAREMFFDDVELDSVYGGFPGSSWCGGRGSHGAPLPLDEVRRLVGRYNELGLACNVTFSNQFVDEEMIATDQYSRAILALLAKTDQEVSRPHSGSEHGGGTSGEMADGVSNGVILYSEELFKYMKDRFPELICLSSTTKGLVAVEDINAELERFDRVVLDYNLTKKESVIQKLDRLENLEVMVNEYCSLGCPYRKSHYEQASLDQISGTPSRFECRHRPEPQAYGFLAGLLEGEVFLRNADIRRYAVDYGIEHFKIVGRGLARYDIVDSYLYYLIKPEYWYEIRDYLIHRSYL